MDVNTKLKELGLALPAAPRAIADYVPSVRTGNCVYVSGMLPMRDGELIATGSVPRQVTPEDAAECARQCVLNGLAAAGVQINGDWSKFVRVVRLAVFVNSDPDFQLQHKVANGASELLGQLFGEAGRHVRAAVGASGLPLGAPVEVEMVIEVE